MAFLTMFFAEIAVFLLMFAFLLWQQWQLNKHLSSPAWKWKIAGYAFAFFGMLIRITLNLVFTIPRTWMYHVTFVNSALALGCLIRAMHLLRRDIKKIFSKTLRSVQPKG
jgi:hypothetical protein